LFVEGGQTHLPKGAAGKVAVVAEFGTGDGAQLGNGPPLILTDQDIVFVLRNNTAHTQYGIQAQATVVNAAGQPLANEQDLGIQPWAVPHGGLAMGSFSFSSDTQGAFPAGSKLRITARGTAGADPGSEIDVPIKSAKAFDPVQGIVGLGQNTTGHRVNGPIAVMWVCLNTTSRLTVFGTDDVPNLDWATPGQQIPFMVGVTDYDNRAMKGGVCRHVLISMVGLS